MYCAVAACSFTVQYYHKCKVSWCNVVVKWPVVMSQIAAAHCFFMPGFVVSYLTFWSHHSAVYRNSTILESQLLNALPIIRTTNEASAGICMGLRVSSLFAFNISFLWCLGP